MEDYVNFETAQLLKKAGFDWCVTEYWRPTPSGRVFLNHVEQPEDINQGPYFSAPTLAMAQKWLREVHGIHVEPRFAYNGLFDLVIASENRQLYKRLINMGWINYESALSAGIKKALELITLNTETK